MHSVTSFLKNFVPGDTPSSAVEAPVANDASEPPASRTLPASRSPISTRPTRASVDIASSPSTELKRAASTGFNRAIEQGKQRKKARISLDEKRLLGDYEIPADATPVPSPYTWVFNRPSPPMKPKPGQDSSFKPVNTIDTVNPRHGQRKPPNTYGSKHRPNLNFLDSYTEQSYPEQARHHLHLREYKQSPPKRRKAEHPQTPVRTISVDDDDVTEVRPLRSHNAHSPPQLTKSRSTASQHSTEGVYPNTSSGKATGLPTSAFQATESIANPHRKKARHNAFNGMSTPRPVVKGSTEASPIRLDDDEPSPARRSTRQTILEDFAQGMESPVAGSHLRAENLSPGIMPRMNPSTAPPRGDSSIHPEGNTMRVRNLRNQFRRASCEDIEETAFPAADVVRTRSAVGRGDSSRKRTQLANSAARRKVGSNLSNEWRLVFIRTHFYEGRSPNLFLLPDENKSICHIAVLNTDGHWEMQPHKIDLQKVHDAIADDTSRIRIKGSGGLDGNVYCYDLEFANTQQFRLFRDDYVLPNTRTQKVIQKPENTMRIVFEKDLPTNRKVGTSALVAEPDVNAPHETSQKAMQERLSRPSRLISQLQPQPSDESKPGTREVREADILGNSNSTLSRPIRSTRSSKLVYDVDVKEETAPQKEVFKWSVKNGLGAPWSKPLQYNSGRHRALVDFFDLLRLDEGEFLNDSLIDFYLIYLFDQAKIPANKVYFFNTHFFSALTRNVSAKVGINYSAVARWTSRDDLFKHDYVVVPINENLHWYLAIICNVSNISRKPMSEDLGQNPIPAADAPSEPIPTLFVDKLEEISTGIEDNGVMPASHGNEDANLFDEETQISLVDPEAISSDHKLQGAATKSELPRVSPGGEVSRMEKLALGDSQPRGILDTSTPSTPTKKKSKRKLGPPPKKINVEEPIVIILDSLGINRSKAVRALKDYIHEEGKAKRGMDAIISQNGFYAKDSHVPMQDNLSDCGVYLLGYAQKFFSDPDGFVRQLLTGEMDREANWPDMEPPVMRDKMRNILFTLGDEQDQGRKRARAEKRAKQAELLSIKTDSPAKSPTYPPTLASPIKLQPSPKITQQSESPPKIEAVKLDLSPASTIRRPRKGSPKVVVQVNTPPQLQSSPKRAFQLSLAEEENSQREGVVEPFTEAYEHSLKRRRTAADGHHVTIGQSINSSGPLQTTSKPPVSAGRHPRTSPSTAKTTSAAALREPREQRGSSHDPIQIDDSQSQPSIFVTSPRKLDPLTISASPIGVMKPLANSVEPLRSPSSSPDPLQTDMDGQFAGREWMSQLQNASRTTLGKGQASSSRLAKLAEDGTCQSTTEEDTEFEGFPDSPVAESIHEGFPKNENIDDTVIPESPAEKRYSPQRDEWVKGSPLPS